MASDRKAVAHQDIAQRVLSLDLPPGKPLNEALLCETYDLSRTPLREVLQRLSGAGFLTMEANRGAFVSSMELTVMRNFFQTAPLVYAAVSRLAAENVRQHQLDQIKSVQTRFRKATQGNDADALVMLNYRFHELIGEMSDSVYLRPSLQRLLIDHTRMSHRFYRPKREKGHERVTIASEQHDALIEAIETHDPDLAAEITIDHWELSRGDIEKYVRPDALPLDSRTLDGAIA